MKDTIREKWGEVEVIHLQQFAFSSWQSCKKQSISQNE